MAIAIGSYIADFDFSPVAWVTGGDVASGWNILFAHGLVTGLDAAYADTIELVFAATPPGFTPQVTRLRSTDGRQWIFVLAFALGGVPTNPAYLVLPASNGNQPQYQPTQLVVASASWFTLIAPS